MARAAAVRVSGTLLRAAHRETLPAASACVFGLGMDFRDHSARCLHGSAACTSAHGPTSASSGSAAVGTTSVSTNAQESIKEHRDHPYLTKNARYLPGFSFPAPRKLGQIIKYALLERESPKRVREIWEKFHDERSDCAAAVLTKAEYEGIMARATKKYDICCLQRGFAVPCGRTMRHGLATVCCLVCMSSCSPFFIYPVRRGEGKFFTLVSQFQAPHFIFTYMEDFRKDPHAAEPYFAVTFFDDFMDRKDIVLVRGDFSGHLTKQDAKRLLNLTKHNYSVEPRLVEKFNQDSASFDIEAYLSSCP